ncbi:hypothetical protein X975_07361, partial [Stegodyphus mimosarum]
MPILKERDVESMNLEELRSALRYDQNKLTRACRQITYLDNQIVYLRKLFRRAEKNNARAVRYNLRMQLSITSGVKVMYHHYAAMKEERISRIRARLNAALVNNIAALQNAQATNAEERIEPYQQPMPE